MSFAVELRDPGGGFAIALASGAPPPGGLIKVWNGSAWVEKPVKYWTGSAWVEKPVKFWSGSAWVLS